MSAGKSSAGVGKSLGENKKILIVEDEEILAMLMEEQLGSLGYEVSIITNSLDAIELFRANPDHFDLVISDQTMPGMTGVEMLSELKQIRPQIHTIICTGHSSTVDEEKITALNIDAYILKPFELQDLAKVVCKVLK